MSRKNIRLAVAALMGTLLWTGLAFNGPVFAADAGTNVNTAKTAVNEANETNKGANKNNTEVNKTDAETAAAKKSDKVDVTLKNVPAKGAEAQQTDAQQSDAVKDGNEGPTPTEAIDWRAEKAAVGKMETLIEVALETRERNKDNDKIDLNAVGRSYTANELNALEAADFVVGPFQLGKPLNVDAVSTDMIPFYKALGGDTTGVNNGTFITYTGENGSYTVYAGPVQDMQRVLRTEGLDYNLPVGAVTNIHITGGDFETNRNIGIGKTRGTVLFAYGAPQAMWRDATHKSMVLVYAQSAEKNRNNKKDFTSTVANLSNKTILSERLREEDQSDGYILFTLVDNKVTAIDLLDGQVRSKLDLPSTELNYFKANELTSRDFVLMGYEVNRPFVTNQDDEWQQRGTLYDEDFLSYDNILIGYDKDHYIARAMITKSTALTRRGISIGDSKYLLLYLYGLPTTIESDKANNGDEVEVYSYKNPYSAHSYLIFVIGEKDNFIKNVMLSDRPHNELER